MSLDAVRTAVAALEARGTAVSIRTLQEVLPDVARSTIGRHLATLRAERGDAPPQTEPSTATAVLEAPRVPHSVPDTLQAVTDAETALEAARARVEALKQQHAPALRQHGLLMHAWQSRAITRQDPAWQDFDQASTQITAAEKAVQQAEEAVKYARQAHERSGYDRAAAEVAQTPEGQALLAKIEEYQQLYEEAVSQRSQKTMSWLMSRDWARNRFKDLVHVHQGLVQPKVPVTEAQRQELMAGAVVQMQRDNPARDRHHY